MTDPKYITKYYQKRYPAHIRIPGSAPGSSSSSSSSSRSSEVVVVEVVVVIIVVVVVVVVIVWALFSMSFMICHKLPNLWLSPLVGL